MIIAVTGGKGGTGKSTVAAALAMELSKLHRVLFADADVECPNAHILLSLERKHHIDVMQRIPRIEATRCIMCAQCIKACMAGALAGVRGRRPIFIESQCNGCGACRIACGHDAVVWTEKKVGVIYRGSKGRTGFLGGELEEGQPASELVVRSLLAEMQKAGAGYSHTIIDTAAGAHCPVRLALAAADHVVAVAEPTPLGAHDLDIILQLSARLGKKAAAVINRADTGDRQMIRSVAEAHSVPVTMEIAFSEDILSAHAQGRPAKIGSIVSVLWQEPK